MRQRVYLRRFVTVVCEHGAAEDLCACYVFGPILPEVEEILSFKARSELPRHLSYLASITALYIIPEKEQWIVFQPSGTALRGQVLAALDTRATALANRADEAVSDGGYDDYDDDDDDFDEGSDSATAWVAALRADLLRAVENYLDKIAAETCYAAGPDTVTAPSPPPLGADALSVGLAARLGPKAANAPGSSPSPMAIPLLFAMGSAAPASPFRTSTGC
ncbi:hypothetical protein HK405_014241 [Cladochytrium tenue]|nr:hypothetical protein HK405_014241 [Cladochytrium tenue]